LALQSKVKKGQVYTDLPSNRPGSRLWKVESFSENAMGSPHARLIDLRDPTNTKMISCSALKSRTYYDLVSEPADDNSQRA
jgi:hypothetical protein